MKHVACIALLPIVLVGCGQETPDPLLAAGEQAIVGSYSLDHVLLRPETVVVLRDSVLGGRIGDTPEQAAKKGILTLAGAALLQRNDCRMHIAADHTFVISNLPAADVSGVLTLRGSWALTVYHFSETYGYRISMKESPRASLSLARFLNADKPSSLNANQPNPPDIEVYLKGDRSGQVGFRFAKTNRPVSSKP